MTEFFNDTFERFGYKCEEVTLNYFRLIFPLLKFFGMCFKGYISFNCCEKFKVRRKDRTKLKYNGHLINITEKSKSILNLLALLHDAEGPVLSI